MGKIEETMKAEIARLAKKEIKAAVSPLNAKIRQLAKQVKLLEKQNTKLAKQAAKPAKAVAEKTVKAAPDEIEDKRKVRFSPAMLKRFRDKINLTQAQMGKLLEVSTGAIVNWEKGIASPRVNNRLQFAELRKMPQGALTKHLKELGIQTGRKKRKSSK